MSYIVLIFLVFLGFRMNLSTGIIVSVIALGYIIYKNIPVVYALLGSKAYNSDDLKKCEKMYDKALKSGRISASVGITYVLILMRTGKLDKALSIANTVIADKKTKLQEKYTLKQYRSLIYFKQGNKEEALEDAYEIFENYKNTTMYGLLGYLKLSCETDLEEIKRFCLEAYEYNSDDRDIIDNLVLCCYKCKEYEKAEELGEKLLEKSPSFVEAHYHLGLVKKALGKISEAREIMSDSSDWLRTALTTVSEEDVKNLQDDLGVNNR